MGVRVISPFPLPTALRQGAATTDRINHGVVRIPNLTESNFLLTVVVIYKLNTFTNQRIVAAKNATDGNGGMVFILNNAGETQGIQMQFNRSVVNAQARSTNVGTQVDRWLCMAGIIDVADTQPRIFFADYLMPGAVMREVTYDGSQTQGSGVSNSSASFCVGSHSNASPSLALQADIHRAAYYPAHLTPAQMTQWMREGFAAGAPAPYVNAWYGKNGISIQLDESGYRNHGVIEGNMGLVDGPPPLAQRNVRRFFVPAAPTSILRHMMAYHGG